MEERLFRVLSLFWKYSEKSWILVPDIPCAWVYFLYNLQLKIMQKLHSSTGIPGNNIQAYYLLQQHWFEIIMNNVTYIQYIQKRRIPYEKITNAMEKCSKTVYTPQEWSFLRFHMHSAMNIHHEILSTTTA